MDQGQESIIADAELVHNHSAKIALSEELDEAIIQHDLVLYYQPQVDVQGCVAAFESLLRWQKQTLIAPGAFLPDLSPQELHRIGQYTARHVIRDLAQHHWIPSLSLNIDPATLDAGLIQLILDELSIWEVSSSRLTVEVTETGLIDNYKHIIELLQRAKDVGIGVAIDDFGTGYSSLQHFKHLPIDELKIDRSFLTALRTDKQNQYLCKMMIDLAHQFGHHVVAEGVEDEWTAQWLFDNECDLLQGYYYTAPVPLEHLSQLFTSEGLDG